MDHFDPSPLLSFVSFLRRAKRKMETRREKSIGDIHIYMRVTAVCHFSGTPSGVSMHYFSRQKGRYAKADPPGPTLSRSLPSLRVGSRGCVALSLLSALLASQPRSFSPLVRSQDHPEEIGAGISGRDDSVSITSRLLES